MFRKLLVLGLLLGTMKGDAMRLGDVWEKMANGRSLSREETSFLRSEGNRLQSQTAGMFGSSGTPHFPYFTAGQSRFEVAPLSVFAFQATGVEISDQTFTYPTVTSFKDNNYMLSFDGVNKFTLLDPRHRFLIVGFAKWDDASADSSRQVVVTGYDSNDNQTIQVVMSAFETGADPEVFPFSDAVYFSGNEAYFKIGVWQNSGLILTLGELHFTIICVQ